MKITKNRKKINSELDQAKNYSVIDAIKMLKSLKFTKFICKIFENKDMIYVQYLDNLYI